MPSIVMLIALWSSPLTIESRAPPAVETPGMPMRNSSALRDGTGRLLIWPTSTVVEIAVDWVWTSGAPVPSTDTVSSMPPTSSVARTSAGVAASTLRPLMATCLNPDSVTVTV